MTILKVVQKTTDDLLKIFVSLKPRKMFRINKKCLSMMRIIEHFNNFFED